MEWNMAERANDYRYERKYVLAGPEARELEMVLKTHPALFSEIYHERFVNNIYLDSLDMKNYFDTVFGSSLRRKVRVRWYGELFGKIEKPVLEFKIKNGLLVKKEIFPLAGFDLDGSFRFECLSRVFESSNIPEPVKLHLKFCRPVLLSRYRRRYYLSADGNYRITLDSRAEYCRLNAAHNAFLHRVADHFRVILELKFSPADNEGVRMITDHFPFRLEKNSKYVNGIEAICLV
jgi:hypothetical protein